MEAPDDDAWHSHLVAMASDSFAFLDPVLAGNVDALMEPESWTWG